MERNAYNTSILIAKQDITGKRRERGEPRNIVINASGTREIPLVKQSRAVVFDVARSYLDSNKHQSEGGETNEENYNERRK